jgi:hypothetical protein
MLQAAGLQPRRGRGNTNSWGSSPGYDVYALQAKEVEMDNRSIEFLR